MNVVAVIPVRDKLHLTRGLVSQLIEDTVVSKVIVLDNGSTDGTREWLEQQPPPVLHLDAPGATIHEMWNRGIDEALTDPTVTAVAVLNNDLDLGPDAMAGCADVLANVPELAVVCPNYDGRPLAPNEVALTSDICAGRYNGTGGLAGFAMIIAVDFLASYRFPSDLRWWYGDNDIVCTAITEGRKVGIVGNATVTHLDGGSQTGDWLSDEFRSQTEADRDAFNAKWANR